MNRRQMISLLAASASAAVPVSALAAVAPPTHGDISRALNAISTLEAAFTQFNADGSIATSTLYMSMPGKVRMEYDQGSNGGLFMVSAGRVAIFDSRSDSIATRVSLDSTPLAPFIVRNVNLRQTREVFDTQADADLLSVYARESTSMRTAYSLVEVRQVIADALCIEGQEGLVEEAIQDGDGGFWEQVDACFEGQEISNLSIHAMDPVTHEITQIERNSTMPGGLDHRTQEEKEHEARRKQELENETPF